MQPNRAGNDQKQYPWHRAGTREFVNIQFDATGKEHAYLFAEHFLVWGIGRLKDDLTVEQC